MLRIARFMKPFLGSVVLAVLLLLGQALCDLNLPNLMSNIVNVGIQQGGVEDSTPRALSVESQDFLKTFMTSDEKLLLDDNYELVKSNAVVKGESGAGAKTYANQYPEAGTELYVLNPAIDADTLTQLDEVFGTTTWTMLGTFKTVQQMNEEGTLEEVLIEQLKARALDTILEAIDDGSIPLPVGMDKNAFAQMILDKQLAEAAANNESPFAGLLGEDAGAAGTESSGAAGNATTTGSSLLAFGTNDDPETATSIKDIDLKQIYQLKGLIELLPEHIITDARAGALAMDPQLRRQSGTMLVGAFYTELGVDMSSVEINYITRVGLFMLLITLLGGAATILVGLLSSRAGAGIARDLRSAVFKKVMAFSHTEFDRFSTASLITRSTNDISQIQLLVSMGIRLLFYAPIMGAGAVFMALQKSASMSWIIGVAVLFMLGVVVVLMAIVMPKFRIIQKLIDRLNLVARESLNGQMVIRAFSRAGFEMNRFEKANADVTNTNLFIQRAMVFMMPIMMIFMNGLVVLIIWIGAQQVAASNMQVGDMMAYMQYAMMVIMSFMFIAMAFIFVPRAQVSAGRIADVLETEPVIADPAQPVKLPAETPGQKRGRVEFTDVSFSYEGGEAPALEQISFVAEAGKTTAFFGSTGSGKSTILNLIPRFYDASEGTVLFDGVDVRDLAIHDLRGRIGYVPQKSLLMSGTVGENISFGNPKMTPEDIEKAAEVAQALDFISKLNVADEISAHETSADEAQAGEPGGETAGDVTAGDETAGDETTDETASGFDFEIAQGGTNVSGGQRQRLAIARALAVDPEVYLFDDSFSALDFATDAALRKALAASTRGATLIIVAQRVSTIMDAQRIYVVDEGRIVAEGTHCELLRTCPQYREVAETQLSPEMIAATLGGDAQ